ncbi:sodium:calcium antiporter [Sphingopyxis sp. XHP0097]|uniref:Sodium:calcium antiporter n=1 Tax=Sphingopyxis jiangsuensis TaxID=2871171 RepID=A0ABS7MB49_9SPHN|nr:sodium:calcium antiporter [Sphingopyxis jiangsuensis]MBY4636033.1 sodium:calcium antiporter [Sphingopyxis jiangsuensis]
MDVASVWIKFALCSALIAVAGPKLVKYGHRIAELTGLSSTWVGLSLLATATSLPELITGVSAVTVADAPNIAVGDALGSCIFNLLMLVLLDELSRTHPVYRRIEQGHILTAGFGVIMIGTVGAAILLNQAGLDGRVLHISLFTPFLILLYLVAMRASFDYQRRVTRPFAKEDVGAGLTLGQAARRYVAAASVVIAAGFWLPLIGVELAETMGWQTTFVGTLLIAASTSVPEFVVSLSALRIGAIDMAISNLLGSNLFDVLAIAIDDLVYGSGPLLSSVSGAHAVTAFAAVIMSGIFIVALLFRPDSRIRGTISWISLSLLMTYLFGAYVSFLLGE